MRTFICVVIIGLLSDLSYKGIIDLNILLIILLTPCIILAFAQDLAEVSRK